MELVVTGVILFVLGLIVGRFSSRPKHYGVIRVDTSDPDDAPYLFLQLRNDKSVDAITRERYVTFKVEVKNFISQK